MKIDGNITAKIINHFTSKKLPILTVHDSYITSYDLTGELRTAMNQSIKEELNGYEINIDQDYIGIDQIRSFLSDLSLYSPDQYLFHNHLILLLLIDSLQS